MPANAVPLNGRGRIASILGRQYTSLRYLNRAIALNGQYTAAYRNRAAVYIALKRNEEAIQDLDKVIALIPDNAGLYVARGHLHRLERHDAPAFKDFQKALEISPDNVQALVGRASLNFEWRRADLALQDLNQALTLDQNSAEAYLWRGQVRSAMNDIEGGEADLSKAIELKPDYSEAYRVRGNMREHAQRHDEAIADYRRAVEVDPFSREAADTYRTASGDTPDSVIKPLRPAVDGWEIFSSGPGQYTALNGHYPKMPVILEVRGDGIPEIVEWTPLKDSLAGIGLLRYRVPSKAGGPYDYVAILDFSRSATVTIEPYIANGAKSKWAWTPNSVTVTDTDGLVSYYELRKPAQQPRQNDGSFSFFGGGGGGGRRGGGGGVPIIGWFFR